MKNNNFKVALKAKFRLNWFFLEHVTLEDILYSRLSGGY